MNKRKVVLKIEEPCHADWSTMTVTEQGKFCSNCSKAVLDFTNSTDLEIITVLQQSSKICGRFRNEQLNRTLVQPGTQRNLSYYTILTSLLLLSAPHIASAQNHSLTVGKVAMVRPKDEEQHKVDLNQHHEKALTGKVVVLGTRQPLAYCSVAIKGTNFKTSTDEKGNFKLVVPDSLPGDKIVLTFTHRNFQALELSVSAKDFPLNQIQLSPVKDLKKPEITMGEVSIPEPK